MPEVPKVVFPTKDSKKPIKKEEIDDEPQVITTKTETVTKTVGGIPIVEEKIHPEQKSVIRQEPRC